jgi:hypothetical protein
VGSIDVRFAVAILCKRLLDMPDITNDHPLSWTMFALSRLFYFGVYFIFIHLR